MNTGSFRIAVASGKGGTGKTTVAVNLALFLARSKKSVAYVDCDVEEPNGHLFLSPQIDKKSEVGVTVPTVDKDLCTACRACAEICAFNAITCLAGTVLIFPELCHGCDGCLRVCPTKALTETTRPIGYVEEGTSGDISFLHGKLHVGEATSPPLIHEVLERSRKALSDTVIIDAPPGTSCPVITAIRGVDFVILVTEPTPFGLNDLGLAIAMVRELQLPFGVIVNRSEPDNELARDFCARNKAPILGEIPFDRHIAEAYSRGETIVAELDQFVPLFADIWSNTHIQFDNGSSL